MFNFAGSEFLLIAVVALVLIGPKDLPVAIKAIAAAIKKMRRMVHELQGHVDEMMREADMASMRDVLDDVRALDIKRNVTKMLDPDQAVPRVRGRALPLPQPPPMPTIAVPSKPALRRSTEPSPWFIPPGSPAPLVPEPEPEPEPPAFVPPATPAPLPDHP